ncbi:MAG: type II CRISPR RNA-guided endonuclease Cas9 [Methylococcaceae bacterium]
MTRANWRNNWPTIPGKNADYALTVLKTDQEIQDHLHANGFPEAEIQALIHLHFKDFVRLSIKALRKLLPLMREGSRYDEAATALYGSHSAPQCLTPSRLLPAIDPDDIRNPVVQRALNQARKVVNALIREYGAPVRIHIELARNLSRGFDERRDIMKAQAQYRDQKQDDVAAFKAQFGFEPHPRNQDLLKWRLYREQDGQCPYTQQPLAAHGDPVTIFDPTRTQIDHVLPYSRSFDDGYNNKVLVMVAANQMKGNHTPYEYLQGASDSPRWQMFEAWVKSNRKLREAKRQRLLRKQFDAGAAREFRDRHLTDTRYICRYFKAQLEQLELAADAKAQRCVVVNGQLTAYLRTRWGLLKDRTDGDLHHALDAAVVAACSHAMVKRLADYSRRGELERVKNPIDAETGEVVDMATLREVEARFPQPYENFREELLDLLTVDPSFGPPIRVSRAPKRRNGGAAHKETIRSSKRMASGGVTTLKTPLTNLGLADLARLAARDDPRNVPLYAAIEERLKAFGGDGKKAFGPDQPPLRKPGNAGTAPIVRGVRLETPQKSGLPVRGGIADNDTMLRVDVFAR